MKTPMFKNIAFASMLFAGLALSSCKDSTREGEIETETDTETLEPMDREGETFESNEMDTQADTVARVNRENPEISVGDQVP